MTDTMPDGDIRHLPAPRALPPSRHVLSAAITIAPEISISGFEQHEKTCRNCGAVRVTVIGEVSARARAWRRTADGPQITTVIEPPCDTEGAWPT